MEKKRTTSFGTMETLVEKDGEIISEYLVFERNGRGHFHDVWEICYVTEGKGTIVNGENAIRVTKGDVCKIPPNTNHWMEPNPHMEVLLVYTNQP